MVGATHVLEIIIRVVDQATKPLKKAQEAVKKTGDAASKASGKWFGLGLSFLFVGMALKRVADTGIKALIKSFIDVTELQTLAGRKLLGLSASWEFLKFSIIDALMSSELFIPMIDFIVRLTNMISSFVATNPALAQTGIILLAIAFIVGFLGIVFGQLILAGISLVMLFGIGLGGAIFLIIGAIFFVILAVAAFVLGFTGGLDKINPKILIILGLLALIFAPFLLPIFLIGVMVRKFIELSKKVGGVSNAFKFIGLKIVSVLATVGDAIINFLLDPINAFIELINIAIIAARTLGLTSMQELGTISVDMSSGITERLAAMLEQGKNNSESSDSSTVVNNNVSIDNTGGDDDKIKRMFEDVMRNMKNESIGSTAGG